MNHHAAKCISCGTPLTTLQAFAGLTCDKLECRGPYLQSQRFQQMQMEREERDSIAKKARARVSEPIPEGIPTAVVPTNQRRLQKLPSSRKESFKSRLKEQIDFARVLLQKPGRIEQVIAETPTSRPVNEFVSWVNLQACSTCRGYCCTSGEDHAYLRASDLEQKIVANDGVTDEELLAEYESHLPEESYEDSCVFHTENGCALPGQWRGTTCHDFVCAGLKDALDQAKEADSPACFAVATDNKEVVRLTYVDVNGKRREL